MLQCKELQIFVKSCTKKLLTRNSGNAYDRINGGLAVTPSTTQPSFHVLPPRLRCCALHHKIHGVDGRTAM